MDFVNVLIHGKKYDKVVDMFLGSGNLIMNINTRANEYIGIDILPLMPRILKYMSINNDEYKLKEILDILDEWKFDDNQQYYLFRDMWNRKYLSNKIDKRFIYETVLLLKMCNNSMVRFNQKGEFNQGFRGIGRFKKNNRFFTDAMIKTIPSELKSLKHKLHTNRYTMYDKDYREVIDKEVYLDKNDLVIMDPPYVLSSTQSYGGTYGIEEDKKLLEFIGDLESDFILFNYLGNNNKEYTGLQDIIDCKGYKVIQLSSKGKLKHISKGAKIREVIITNI